MSKKILILTEDQLERYAEKVSSKIIGKSQSQNHDSEELLDVKQASEVIKLTVPTIYGLVHKNSIPYFKRGRKLYFKKSQLIEWITSKDSSSSKIKELEQKADAYLIKNNLY